MKCIGSYCGSICAAFLVSMSVYASCLPNIECKKYIGSYMVLLVLLFWYPCQVMYHVFTSQNILSILVVTVFHLCCSSGIPLRLCIMSSHQRMYEVRYIGSYCGFTCVALLVSLSVYLSCLLIIEYMKYISVLLVLLFWYPFQTIYYVFTS